jgi:PqqD family protein of HPr-rel-A system
MADRFAAAPGIRTFDFGDEWVILNPLSWDAHLLNAAAAIVLEQLGAEPQSEDEIADTLRDLLVDAEQADAGKQAQRLIGDLVQLGLVHKVPAGAGLDR